jgi:hypothetical protein
MRLKKPKRRFDVPAQTKPKRTDLNETQKRLLKRVLSLRGADVLQAELRVMQGGIPGEVLIPNARKGATSFYDPKRVAAFLGWSKPTIERYMYLYLRIVRRPGESPADYRERKNAANPDSAPLVSSFEHTGGDLSKVRRLLSSRILIFLVLAPAYLKGENRQALRDLREEFEGFGLKSGKAKKIGPSASVIRWVTEEAGEVTL